MKAERRFGKMLLLLVWCVTQGLWGATNPKIVVGTRTQTPPYEYSDERGRLTGYCVEVLQACAEIQGLDLEFRRFSNTQPFKRAARKLAVILFPALLLLGVLGQLVWTFSLRRLVKRRTSELRLSLRKREEAEIELKSTVERLSSALHEVKQLSGLLPICANCKKIRDSKGGWQPLESYISAKSEATFTHGICPECSQELYPEYHADGAEGHENSHK